MVDLRAFGVSLAFAVSLVSLPCLIMSFILVDVHLGTLTLILITVLVICGAVLVAWKYRNRIHDWWLKGYDDYVYSRKITKSAKPEKNVALATESNLTVERVESDSPTVESQNGNKEARGTMLEMPAHKSILTLEKSSTTVETPSKEDLARLKEASEMRSGSLVYKKSGDKIYVVTYDRATKKKKWTQLGLWSELQKLIRNQ